MYVEGELVVIDAPENLISGGLIELLYNIVCSSCSLHTTPRVFLILGPTSSGLMGIIADFFHPSHAPHFFPIIIMGLFAPAGVRYGG